ncbi:MAG: translocation/assembly module TamB domain-containing protein [Solirubrobacterales bacterium]
MNRRRAAKAALLVVLLLALLALLAATPFAKRLAQGVLTGALSARLGGPATIAGLDYGLLSRNVVLTGITVTRADPALTISLDRLEVRLVGWSRVAVRVDRPRVTLGPSPPKAATLPGDPRPWALLGRLKTVEVTSGELRLVDATGHATVELRGLDASLSLQNDGRHHLVVGGFLTQSSSGEPLPIRIEADVRGGLTLDVLKAGITAGPAHADARGQVTSASPFAGNLAGTLAADLSLLGRWLEGAPGTGAIEASWHVETANGHRSGRVDVAGPALSWGDLGPWALQVRAEVVDDALELRAASLRGYRGQIDAEGRLALGANGTGRAGLRYSGLDVTALLRDLRGPDVWTPPLTSRAGGTAELKLAAGGRSLAGGQGKVRLEADAAPAPEATTAAPLSARAGLPVSGDARWTVARDRWTLAADHLAFPHGGGDLEAHGGAGAAPAGRFALVLDEGADLSDLIGRLGFAPPPIRVAGALRADGRFEAGLGTARVTGEAVRVEGVAFALEAEVEGNGRGLRVAPLSLEGPHGRLRATGTIPLVADELWDLAVEAERFDLGSTARRFELPVRGLLTGNARIAGPFRDPDGDADVLLAELAAGEGQAPIGELRLHLTKRLRRVELASIEGMLLGGPVSGSGAFDLGSRAIEGKLRGDALRLGAWPGRPEALRSLEGNLAFVLDASGTPTAPLGSGHATLGGLTFEGSPMPSVALDIVSDGTVLRLTTTEPAGLLTGECRIGGDWPVRLDLDLAAFPSAPVLAVLPRARDNGAALHGTGTVTLEFPARRPSEVRYSAAIESMEGRWQERSFSLKSFHAKGDLAEVTLEGFEMLGEDNGRLRLDGQIGLGEQGASNLSIDGDMPLRWLTTFFPKAELTGRATLSLKAVGRRDSIDLTGPMTLEAEAGRWSGFGFAGLSARAEGKGASIAVEKAELRAFGGTISLSGTMPLPGRTGGPALALAVAWSDLDLGVFVPHDENVYQPQQWLVTAGSGRLTAPSFEPKALAGEGEVTLLAVTPDGTEAKTTAPAAWRVADGKLSIDALHLHGTQTDLKVSLHAGLDEAWSAQAAGTLDTALLNILAPPGWSLAGRTKIDLRASSGSEGMTLTGDVQLADGLVRSDDPPVAVTDITGGVRFRERTFDLTDLKGRMGSGSVSAEGGGELGPEGLKRVEITVNSENAEITYPRGFFAQLAGSLVFSGGGGRYRLAGDLRARRARYTAEFDAASQSLATLDSQLRSLTRREDAFSDRVVLDLKVRTTEDVRVENSLVQATAGGSASVGGTLASYSVEGSLMIRPGGTAKVGRTRATITSGRVDLDGYPLEPPELDVSLEARAGGTNVQMKLEGRTDNLKTVLTAPDDPNLTESDVASLLLTGRALSTASQERGDVAAEAVVAGLGSALQGQVGGAFTFQVGTGEEGLLADEANPKTRFTVGSRVSERLTVAYSTGLDGQDQRWILDFEPATRVRFRGLREENNTYAVEAYHRINLFARGRQASARGSTRRDRGEVKILGDPPVPEAELRKELRGKVGKPYDYWVAQTDADRMRDKLVEAGYLGARVDLETERTGNSRTILYRIDAGERITIDWTGDDPGEDFRKKAVALWDPTFPPETRSRRLAQLAQLSLRADRYYLASVTASDTHQDGQWRVTLHAVLGPRGRRVVVQFPGRAEVSEDFLRSALPDPRTPEFFALLQVEELPRLALNLRGAYAAHGFLETQIGKPETAFDAASGHLNVTIPVTEGERRLLAVVELPDFPTGKGPSGLKLAPGEPLSISDYVHDRALIAQYYREQGFPDVHVHAAIEKDPEGARLVYTVEPGSEVRVGTITIRQSGETKQSLIRGALAFREGDVLRPSHLAQTRRQLSQIGVFRSVDVRAVASKAGPGIRDVTIQVVERAGVEVDYGLRYRTGDPEAEDASLGRDDGSLEGGARATLVSPFGYGVGIGAFGLASTSRELFGLRLSVPRIFGGTLPTQVYFRVENKDVTDYEERARSLTLTVQQLREVTEKVRLQWSYAFSRRSGPTLVRDGIIVLEGTNRGAINLSLIGDFRDSFTNPTRGRFWSGNVSTFADGLGSDESFVRLYGQVYQYLTIGPLVWAQGLRLGLIPGSEKGLLPDDLFQTGGPSSVRGFEVDGLGPQTPDGALGGQALMVFNEELRFRIRGPVYGGVFLDVGNVFATSADFALGDLRANVGAGLRYLLSFGVIRVDWARVLSPKEGEKKDRFLFSLGHAF